MPDALAHTEQIEKFASLLETIAGPVAGPLAASINLFPQRKSVCPSRVFVLGAKAPRLSTYRRYCPISI
jgi:hypothetical protein